MRPEIAQLLSVFLIFALSAVLTRLMIKINVEDIPNHRSSHDRPTPKSGGVAIALGYCAGVGLLFAQGEPTHISAALIILHLALGLVLLGVGLADDMRELSPLTKLLMQFAVAASFSFGVGAFDHLPLPFLGDTALGVLSVPLTVLWIVGVMNLINFMDGINGLVSGSAIIAALVLALMSAIYGSAYVHVSGLILVAATAGFFVFNFPSGRIFLGDSGSMFIAYVLATLAVMGARYDGGFISPAVVPILISPLLYDAIFTLFARAARGQKLWVAHRDHLYQRLVRAGMTHVQVSGLYFALAFAALIAAWFAQTNTPVHAFSALLCLLPLYGAFTLWVLWRTGQRVSIGAE